MDASSADRSGPSGATFAVPTALSPLMQQLFLLHCEQDPGPAGSRADDADAEANRCYRCRGLPTTVPADAGRCSAMCGRGLPRHSSLILTSRQRPKRLLRAVLSDPQGAAGWRSRMITNTYRNFFSLGRPDVMAGLRTCPLYARRGARSASTSWVQITLNALLGLIGLMA